MTNATGSGSLDVRRGLLGIGGGALTVDQLIVTNADGQVSFISGTLTTRGSAVTNGAAFVIGDGAGDPAAMNLLGGTHGFNDGLTVNYDGRLAGSGTVFADLTHYGLIVASNGTLQLNGTGTGNGVLQVRPGATLEFAGSYNLNGAVTNLGFINIADGVVQLLGTIRGAGGAIEVQPATILEIGGNVASVITNQGALQLYSGASSFTLSGGLDNQGNFAVKASQLVNVSGGLANSGAIVVNDNAILSASGFSNQLHAGSMFLNEGSSLQVGRAWTNAGVIQLDQSTLQGGAIANSVLIEGSGTIAPALTNQAGGTVRAEGGVLRLAGAVANQTGAYFEARAGATLNLARGLNNYGTVNSRDGVVDLQSNTLTNYGTLSGFGTFKAGLIENRNQAHFEGGSIDVEAVYLNTNGASTVIAHSSAIFFGAVTNASGSTIKLTGGYATFMGDFYNNGLYYSDPATNTFETLALGPSGALMGGIGDEFILGGDLLNYSTNATAFDITQATVNFAGVGAHTFLLAGEDLGATWAGFGNNFAVGTLELVDAALLKLEDAYLDNLSAALYVDYLNAEPQQISSAYNVYYNPASNPSLNNQTFALSGGGWLIPVPEPATWMLLLAGAGALVSRRRRVKP